MMTLIKKEFNELFKTKKFLVIPITLSFFAMSSPIIARFMLEILEAFMPADADMLRQIMPEANMLDAYEQLVGNFTQIGYFVLIFVSTSLFIGDKTSGRLLLLLSKPLNRGNILISKFINLSIQIIVSVLLASMFFIPYTQYLFNEFNMELYLVTIILFITYGIFLISVSMLASTISKTYLMSVLITIFVFFFFGIASIINNDIFYVLPGKATSIMMEVAQKGTYDMTQFLINLVSTLLLSALLIYISIFIFKNQEIE